MKILRDLRAFTKLLILLELKSQPRIKMQEIADRLDVTIQAVSEYIKLMINDNLILKTNGEYRLTQIGVEFLHNNISELKEFLDKKIEDLDIINECTAIAGEDLNKGEKVYLSMEGGLLIARKNAIDNNSDSNNKNESESQSNGLVLYDVKSGTDVAIGNLKGILDYEFGNLTILTLPSTKDGGSKLVSIKKFEKLIKDHDPDRVAIYDLIGYSVIKKLGLDPDIEFSSLAASVEAIQRGYNVMLLTSMDTLSDIVSQLEFNNSQTKNKIHYSVLSWKEIKE